MSTRLIAPVVSAAAVVTLILGISVAVRGGDDPGPRPLSLASGGGTESLAAPAAAGAAADSRSAGGPGRVRLDGSLPDDPDEARAYDLAARSDEDAVRDLARALGLSGEPKRADGRWTIEADGRRLDLDANGYWSYFPMAPECGGPDSPVSSDLPYSSCMVIDPAPASDSGAGMSGSGSGVSGSSDGSAGSGGTSGSGSGSDSPASGGGTSTSNTEVQVLPAPECPPDARCAMPPDGAWSPAPTEDCPPESCTPARPGVAPQPEPEPVPEDVARDAAGPIFSALGVRGDVSVMQGGGVAIAMVNPRVDGMRTVGWTSQVEVARDGEVRSGSGWVGEARGADVYPLVTAKAAFAEWSNMFGPPVAGDCGGPAETCPAVMPGPDMVVTDAEIGLMLTYEKERQLLVPAWLFTVTDLPEPFAHLAIDPAYLTPPDEPRECLLPEGCTEPDPAASIEPAPAPEPGQPAPSGAARSTFAFDRWSVSADGVTLTVGYGESGSCPRESVTAEVKESPDSVVVLLTENAPPPDRACTFDYQAVDTAVTLAEPLGKRPVVDGSTGRPVEPQR